MQVNPMVVDLSHWDAAYDYSQVAQSGYAGCIYKATEGGSYTDPTYVQQQHAAKAAGLCWGAYHFADGSDVQTQIDNFMKFAMPDPDELFCLDWEDNGGNVMSLDDVKHWISGVETRLGRPGECVLYSGNTAKEALGDSVDAFLGARRLWLCQYGSTPTWQKSWKSPWLWQFTDGQNGPTPHSVDGAGPCDINSYADTAEQLASEWATGTAPVPVPPTPSPDIVQVLIVGPPGVIIKVRQMQYGHDQKPNRKFEGK
jgi:lysozyme